MDLTPRKRKILDFISEYQGRHRGITPTLQEIAEYLGLNAVSTIHVHIRDLVRMGYLEHRWNEKRGLRILDPEKKNTWKLMGTIAAGKPIEAIEDPGSLDIPEELFGAGNNYLLRVTGESMIEEGIRDGDYVVVRHSDSADEGEMIVALVNGEVTLKRFFRDKNTIRLQPSNPSMKPLFVSPDDLRIQGIVVGLLRKY